MKMRVSIARALSLRPKLLLMDEPFAALDEITRFRLNDDLLRLQRELHCTVVFVTHSVYESVYLSSRIVVMAARPGRIVAEIPVEVHAVRGESFRSSPLYADLCRQTSEALHGAHGTGRASMSDSMAFSAARPGRTASVRPFDWNRVLKVGLPLVLFVLTLWAWESYVVRNEVPAYILPAPSAIWATLIKDWPALSASLLTTLKTTFLGLLLAIVGGVALAVLLSLSRVIEYSLYPYAVVLQVTPVVAISPLLLIYLDQDVAVLACAWIVAFFPVLSNTTLGLQSVDRNLLELFDLYGATRPKWAPAVVGRFLPAPEGPLVLRRPADPATSRG